MRGTAVGLMVLAAGFATADSKKTAEWKEYTFPEWPAKVRFPSQPEFESKELATAAGAVKMSTFRVKTRNDLVLSLTMAVYDEKFKDLAAKTVLDGVRDGLKGTDGQLAKGGDAVITLDTPDGPVTGREVRVDAGKNTVHCRAFLVGHRLYQVMATGPRDAVAGPATDQFFKSFELLK